MGAQRDSHLRILEAKPDIEGRFVNLRRLGSSGGSGAFSIVLIGTDVSTGTDVALKFFNPEQTADAYRVRSFEREAALLTQLADKRYLIPLVAPHSTFVETVTVAGGIQIPFAYSYYAMELGAGDLLEASASGHLSPSDIVEVFAQACKCLQYLHSKDVAHRDVKPSNFLFMEDASLRLGDLGTARRLSDPGLLGSYAGFPPGDRRYTAPELLASLHDDDPRLAIPGDFFSLGAVLFQLWTGQPVASYIYNQRFWTHLVSIISSVPLSTRRVVYDGSIAVWARANPLPRMADHRHTVPAAILPYVESTVRSLLDLDYRRRLTTWNSVFRQIDIWRIILRNERQYQSWLQRRRAFRARRGSVHTR